MLLGWLVAWTGKGLDLAALPIADLGAQRYAPLWRVALRGITRYGLDGL